MTEFRRSGTDLSVRNDSLRAINHLQRDQSNLRPRRSFTLRNKQSRSYSAASIDSLNMSLTNMLVISQGPSKLLFARSAVKGLGQISPTPSVLNALNGSVINVLATMFARFLAKRSTRWFVVIFAWNAKSANVAAAIVSGPKARSTTSTMSAHDVWSKRLTYDLSLIHI